MIRYDRAMRTVLKITERFPTDDATNKWLGRMGLGGIYGLQGLSRALLGRYLKKIPDEALVLDIDASVIESHKSMAACTYKSVPGYTPMLAHINGGFVIHSEFRSDNIAPADHNLSFVRQCEAQLPEGKRFAWLRADSASYQADLFNLTCCPHVLRREQRFDPAMLHHVKQALSSLLKILFFLLLPNCHHNRMILYRFSSILHRLSSSSKSNQDIKILLKSANNAKIKKNKLEFGRKKPA